MKLKPGDKFTRVIALPAPTPTHLEKINKFWMEFDIAFNTGKMGYENFPNEETKDWDTFGYILIEPSDEVIKFKMDFGDEPDEDGYLPVLQVMRAVVVPITDVHPELIRKLFTYKYKMQTPKDFLKN